MMYLPEVLNNNNEQSDINTMQRVASGSQEQQEEIFDDIVANTNPILADLPNHDLNLYVNHNEPFFNMKRDLQMASRNNMISQRHPVSEFNDK
jgi:hypothetical protein